MDEFDPCVAVRGGRSKTRVVVEATAWRLADPPRFAVGATDEGGYESVIVDVPSSCHDPGRAGRDPR